MTENEVRNLVHRAVKPLPFGKIITWMLDRKHKDNYQKLVPIMPDNGTSPTILEPFEEDRIRKIKALAEQNGWTFLEMNSRNKHISFIKGKNRQQIRINIYYTTDTVGLCFYCSAKKRKTQSFRKNVSFEQLRNIFKTPRENTDKGYYKK